MIKLLFPVGDITVAASGGVDSMALLSYFNNGKRKVRAAFFDHGTPTSKIAREFLIDYCGSRSITLIHGRISSPIIPKGRSAEDYWREQRYKFLHSLEGDVATAHHLSDCVETWVWSCMHGNPKIISTRYNNVIRPILGTDKDQLINWCQRRNIEWLEDPTNEYPQFTRNYIRHNLLPHAYFVNPGLKKTVYKLILKQEKTKANE